MIKYYMAWTTDGNPVVESFKVVNENGAFYYDENGHCLSKTTVYDDEYSCIRSAMQRTVLKQRYLDQQVKQQAEVYQKLFNLLGMDDQC